MTNVRVLLGLVGGLALMLLNNGPLGLLGEISGMLTCPMVPVLFGVISLFGLIAVLICSFTSLSTPFERSIENDSSVVHVQPSQLQQSHAREWPD